MNIDFILNPHFVLTTIITFIFFFLESITNYNLGKMENNEKYNLKYFINLFKIPPYKDSIKIIISVAFFSLASSFTIKLTNKLLGSK